jgi:Flp pilus assembly protein TadG
VNSRKSHKNQRGQATLELAVVLPLLLALCMGIIEYGFVFWTKTTFESAVRDGARSAVVIQDWSTQETLRASDIKALVKSRTSVLPSTMTTGIENHITVTLQRATASPYNIESIQVAIHNQPYQSVVGFLPAGAVPDTLSATATFRFEN